MLEVLFLLLPIAACYGWYMGRRGMRQQQQQKQGAKKKDYFTGLNFILSNESDKAVDLLVNLLDKDSSNIDTHLSLGVLFRTRGEVDRAIKIHQGLISRPSLSGEQLELAMLALGKDYMAAGFYDRAEEIFVSLLDQVDEAQEAESQLISLYQTTKEWQKATDVIKGMPRSRRSGRLSVLAHFHCQLSLEVDSKPAQVKLLKQALKYDRNCGRAILELITLTSEDKDFESFKKFLYLLLEADIELVPEVIEQALSTFKSNNDLKGYKIYLQEALSKGAGASVTIALVTLLLEQDNLSEAEQLLLGSLYRHPTMRGFKQLMHIHAQQAEAGSAKQSLTMLEKLVEQQIKYRPSYRCQQCGFPSHTLYWHCPSCKCWGKIKRIRGLDGE